MSDEDIRNSLTALLAPIAEQAHPCLNTRLIDTEYFIATLAAHWPKSADREQRLALRQFARKLAVEKRLYASYAGDWRRVEAPPNLPPRGYFSAAAVLLAFASLEDCKTPEGRGFGLHLANGALFARDRGAEVPLLSLQQFDALSSRLLASLIHD